MRFFDARIDPTLRTDADLANLAWFGATAGVVGPPSLVRVETAAGLLAAFQRTLDVDVQRVRAAGLDVAVVLGIGSAARPRRSHPEALEWLDRQAAAGRLAGVGPLDTDDEPGLIQQLEIAARHGLPAVVRVPALSGAAAVETAVAASGRLGPSRPPLVFDGCDYTSLRPALDAGAGVVIDVSPGGQGPGGVDMLARYGEAALSRAMLASGGGPALDVIAIPRAAARLIGDGLPRPDVDRLLYGNTAARFRPEPAR